MKFIILDQFPDAEIEARWNEFLADAEMATHYSAPDFFIDPFAGGGKRFAILVIDENKSIVAVLTGVEDGNIVESGLAVRPQIAFRRGANCAAAAVAMAEALIQKAATTAELIRFYSWKTIDGFENSGFDRQSDAGQDRIVMLDLSLGAANIFKGFSQTRRNEIRKALKQNVLTIKDLETEDEVAELYAIHLDWNRRKRIQPDSFEDFKSAASQKKHRKIIIAKFDGRVIAGSYYRFCRGGVVEYAANNSLVEFQKYRPNDLIGWRSIEWACGEGFSHYSMGGSHLFLRRFGGYELAVERYQMDRTFFQKHKSREAVRNFLIKSYKAIPVGTRQKIKRLAGKV